jgi:hypothetical protein
MIHTHQTAPTQFVKANGIRFAYRRFGRAGGVPLVFVQHFTGTMDHWDPLVTDGLAATRDVILFNNAGISSSSGEVPSSAEEMAANAAAFIKALGLAKVDVLGFSLGGFVAQARRASSPPPRRTGDDQDRRSSSGSLAMSMWVKRMAEATSSQHTIPRERP